MASVIPATHHRRCKGRAHSCSDLGGEGPEVEEKRSSWLQSRGFSIVTICRKTKTYLDQSIGNQKMAVGVSNEGKHSYP